MRIVRLTWILKAEQKPIENALSSREEPKMTLLGIIAYGALAAIAIGVIYLLASTVKTIITDIKEGY